MRPEALHRRRRQEDQNQHPTPPQSCVLWLCALPELDRPGYGSSSLLASNVGNLPPQF